MRSYSNLKSSNYVFGESVRSRIEPQTSVSEGECFTNTTPDSGADGTNIVHTVRVWNM